jgi:hypothetical protein
MAGTPIKNEPIFPNVDDVHIHHDIVPIKTISSSVDNYTGSTGYKLKTKNLSTMVESVAFGVHMVSPSFNFNDSDDEAEDDKGKGMIEKGKIGAASAAVTAPSVSVSLSSQFTNAFTAIVSPVSVFNASPYTDPLPSLPSPAVTSITSTAPLPSALSSTVLGPIIEDEEEGAAAGAAGRIKSANVSQRGADDEDAGDNGTALYSSRSLGDSYTDKNMSAQSSERNGDQGPTLVPFTANRPRPLEILPVRVPCNPIVFSCLALSCLALPCLALPCLALPCLALPCLALPCLALPCLDLT